MKTWKKLITGIIATGILLSLSACGSSAAKKDGADAAKETEEFVIGVAPGPYGEMASEVISPLLEKQGFKLTTKQFNDYVQPNKALDTGQIDGNLFQHTAYLEKFSSDNNLSLTALDRVPTLGMGIYSKKLDSLNDLKDKSTVAIASDASNLARTLQLLEANDLITLNKEVDETKATVSDIAENPKNLEFKTLDAAQLARSLDTVDLALVPGNFAWAASLDPADALALESLKEEYKNVFVVRSDEADSEFGKAVKAVLSSQEFKDGIADSPFKDFDKPASWTDK
ncbi:MetQ/NlpA family ABC transporter substrate-binding protein [Enterococcus sp. LJL128]|uniref:MetQ/NlpA family ABC transporter substrate-binding protein n=1 Tax=Enterococcus sp. LJL51 TaxID=3416656 RepID=UPI003CF12BEA